MTIVRNESRIGNEVFLVMKMFPSVVLRIMAK